MEVRHLELRNAKLDKISFEGLRSEVATIYCTSVEGQFGIMHTNAHELFLNRVNAISLDIRRAELASLYFNRPELEVEGTSDAEKGEAPEQPRPEKDVRDGDAFKHETEVKETPEIAPCSWPDAPKGSFNQIWLESSEISTLRLNGIIEEALFAPRLRVDKLAFAGDLARLGPSAIINLHQATVGSLALPKGRLRHREGHTPSLWLDGADIGSVRLYDPNRDGGRAFAQDPVSPGYWPVVKAPSEMQPYGRDDYDALLREGLLPALSLATSQTTAENYSGATYQFLRRSMEEEGFPDLARDVAVMQNDHYAQTLGQGDTTIDAITGSVLRQIYRTGKLINRYGYDNGRAVLWLLLLWLIGVVMLTFENRRLAQGGSDAKVRHPFWPSLFLSADRTIPTLGIDENFSRPAHVDGKSAQRAATVTVLLYMQRFFAFIVVIFMVGGVLDVFQ